MGFVVRRSSHSPKIFEVTLGARRILATPHEGMAHKLASLFGAIVTLRRVDVLRDYDRVHVFVDFLYFSHELASTLMDKSVRKGGGENGIPF